LPPERGAGRRVARGEGRRDGGAAWALRGGKERHPEDDQRPAAARLRGRDRGRAARAAAQAQGAGAAALQDRLRVPIRRAVRLDERGREHPARHSDETCYNDEKFCENRVLECLRLVNLPPEVATKLPAELSGGMKKRVGIARAIAGQPKYLLYDEPTSGLDPVNADVIDGLIERLRDELGVTSVV